tara:strand:+ start:950 stop:1159 length:210 start_codon:yes stop_codon:yes gene_type:complete
MDPKVLAQEEAERTFDAFMLWTKRVVMYSAIFLGIVVFGCNSGVETGKGKTGSQYNGEQYDPYNLNKDK